MEKRSRELVKNTGIISLGTFLPKLASFVTLPILTAYLTKTEYGTYDLITTLVSLVLPIATLKLETAIFRFLIGVRKDEQAKTRIITTALTFMIPVSLIVVSVMYFFLPVDPLIRILICIYFLIDSFFRFVQQIARGMGRNMAFSVSSVVHTVLNMLLIVILVGFKRAGLIGLLISMNISMLISTIVMLMWVEIYRYYSISEFSKETLKEMVSYSWPMLPNSLSSWVMRLSDRFVIIAVMGIEASAVYAVANKIPQLMSIAQSTFVFAWQENASLSVNDNDVSTYYSKTFKNVFDLMIGVFAGLIAITPILFKLLVKGDYQDAYYQMPILYGGMFFSAISAFLGGIYVAHMKTKSVGITTMIAAVINLVVDICSIHFIGLYAASGSTLISYIVLCGYRMIDVQKFQKVHYNWKRICFSLLVIVVMSVMCFQRNLILNIVNFALGLTFAIIINRTLLSGLIKTLLHKQKSGG